MFQGPRFWGTIRLAALLFVATPDAEAQDLSGSAKDKTGAVLVNARVVVMTPQRNVVATTTTDKSGTFTVKGLPAGQYVVEIHYPPLEPRRGVATVGADGKMINLVLDAVSVDEDVTVTASPGVAADRATLTMQVNHISETDILQRAKTVTAQAVEGETGVHLQRTSPGMSGIFVRGLTGNKVNVFIDGVRFSNGAQRGGVNTFLNGIDSSWLDGIEVLRGTTSAEYGSDALGGSVQFLSHTPTLSPDTASHAGGSVIGGFETAQTGGVGAVSLSHSRTHAGIYGSFSARKSGDVRPGGGEDSHSAITRFLGLSSKDFYGARMEDLYEPGTEGTGFTQNAFQVRGSFVPSPTTIFTANYMRSRQDGANRWDQLLGGDGNLIAQLNDIQVDVFYARVEKFLSGAWFDRMSATYSFNTQREERVNQGGNGDPNALIGHEPERTSTNGVQANASKQINARTNLLVGGDAYFEKLTSDAFDVNPTTGAETDRRPRVPDQATYHQSGLFGQVTYDVKPDLMTIVGAVRGGWNSYRAHASDAPIVSGRPLWPDDALDVSSFTFRLGAAITPVANWKITAAVARGFRAPHMTDLGTLGLTGSGFEVAAPDIVGLGGQIGSTADANAVSTGREAVQVESERSLTYDFAASYSTSKVRASAGFFVNNIDGNIQKQSLILPQGAVGTVSLGGQPVTQQTANGAVFVALSASPVLVRANFDDARIWGFEWSGDFDATEEIKIGTRYTWMQARDLNTDLPPNIEGGTPAPGGTVYARYTRKNSSWWVEPYLNFAGEQDDLSTLDAGDRRTGAGRTNGSIQNFFRRGARVRGLISPGADGIFQNADDILIATGETLAQVQARVLAGGPSLFTAVEGYAVFGVRFGWHRGPHSVFVDFENLGDQNYRGISWGMDAPGRGVSARYSLRF